MRLIDADALEIDMVIEEAETPLMPWYPSNMPMRKTSGVSIEQIDNAPTIDAVPRWIPCEERLPEIGEGFCSKDVLVALDDGGIAFTCLEATLFGSVCWQIERMNEIEDGKEINVIAWMPLPEPYVGERKDDE